MLANSKDCDRATAPSELDSEPRAIILQYREFFFDIAALGICLQSALAGGFKLVESGNKAFQSGLQTGWRTHPIYPERFY